MKLAELISRRVIPREVVLAKIRTATSQAEKEKWAVYLVKNRGYYAIMEMTLKEPDMDEHAAAYAHAHSAAWKQGKHVGDIEKDLKIRKLGDIYSVWHNETLVACLSAEEKDSYHLIDQVWVDPYYRNKKIFSALLWFLKTREGYSKMLLGDVHSSAMQEVIKKLKMFDRSWIKGDEHKSFSSDTVDDFYGSIRPTGWRLMLENDGDFINWPRYFNNTDFVREAYFSYIEQD